MNKEKKLRIIALTEKGEKNLRKLKPENGQIKKQKLYDKPLTYLFSFRGFQLRLKVTDEDIKKMFPLLMRPAELGVDYTMVLE